MLLFLAHGTSANTLQAETSKAFVHCVLLPWNAELELPHKKSSPTYGGKRDLRGKNGGILADCLDPQPARHGTEILLDLPAL